MDFSAFSFNAFGCALYNVAGEMPVFKGRVRLVLGQPFQQHPGALASYVVGVYEAFRV